MSFESKSDLIEFVKNQLGIELKNEDCLFNGYSRLLYTEIPKEHQNAVFSLLEQHEIRYETHYSGMCWIFLQNERTEKK